MKLYIAGAGGMLGEALHKVLAAKHQLKCTDKDVNESWLERCDFRERTAYEASVREFAPDMLLHVGAYTDLEYCEKHEEDAYLTNTLSVEHAAAIANGAGIPLVYISTAGIFDGEKQLYDDWDLPRPLGVYGRTKHIGEMIVQGQVPHHFIFRAGWMMGGGPRKDKKFVAKILKQLLAGKTTLKLVDDRLGTPTYTVDFARNLAAMIETDWYGLYNMVCGGETSRLDVGRELVRLVGLQDKVAIEAVPSDYFGEEYFAPRPPSERLVNRKLELRGMNLMSDWRAALDTYVRDYYSAEVSILTGARAAA